MKSNCTELVFILDRSGSMSGLEADTIGGFNSMIEKQKQESGEAMVTTILFDSKVETLHDRVELANIQPMTNKDYYVRGMTALLDAVGSTIQHISHVHTVMGEDNVPEHNMYVGSSAGAIVQALITTRTGNPVICIDEIDKASGGHTGTPNFQNELLSALDDSCEHWHDNYVELDLDISHIPFVFTANNIDAISTPLLDRMEVIEMEVPTREMLHEIAEYHMLPKVLDTYNHSQLKIGENTIAALVDYMWDAGNRSCRPYKKAIDLLVSDAYLEMLESNRSVIITERDAFSAAQHFSKDSNCRAIGFLTA